MKRRITLACFIAFAMGAALAAGQQTQGQRPPADADTPTFRAEIEYVEVDALVTDEEGRFVRDLTVDDFEVFEDGERQEIAAFSLVDIPIEASDRPLYSEDLIEPDVQSNERPFDGRVYVMILDDLQTDFTRSVRVKLAAKQFIERYLGANDLMAVVHTGGRSDAAQEFTSNRRLLIESVEAFAGRKLQSAILARNDRFFRTSDAQINNGRIPDPFEQERRFNARSSLEFVREIAEWFGGVRGRRKAILLFSEGVDVDVTDLIRDPQPAPMSLIGGAVRADIEDAVSATARSNVSIYAIDPRGLTGLTDEAIGVTQFADAHTGGFGTTDDADASGLPSSQGIGSLGLGNELWLSQQNLITLSEETNGFATVNRSDFSTSFDRIVRDNSSYYVLAYYPPSSERDGKFHRIEVRVTRPGLSVRSRRGYAAPRGDPPEITTTESGASAAVIEALGSPLPISGLTMQAFAAPFKGEGSTASVLLGVELSGSDFVTTPDNVLELSYVAVDQKSEWVDPKNDTLTLNLRPEARERVEQTGVRFLNRLDLKPGRYQLRLASHDTAGGAVGSLIYDLEVPDFSKEKFHMSGVVLTSMASSAMPTVRPDAQLQELLPAPPIAQRVFPPNDELALYTEIYDDSGRAPHRVDIVATVRSDSGTTYFTMEDERDSSELEGERGGYGYAARIPLTDLTPGAYVLSVSAKSRLSGDFSDERHIRFRIAPRADSMPSPAPSMPR